VRGCVICCGCKNGKFEVLVVKEPEEKLEPVTPRARAVASVVFLAVAGIFGVLFAGASGWIDMSRLFGICGFKQVYGLPCPTCYVTTSAMAFVQGRVLESFYIQPAGAVLCCVLVAVGVAALLISVFGVNFAFLHQPLRWRMIKYLVASALIILAAGWAVTLSRAL
jgi:hypothetical protein